MTLLFFHSDWCNPCQKMKPIMEEVAKEYKVEEIDISNGIMVKQFEIMSVPQIILLRNNEEVGRIMGLRDKEYILEKVREYEK